MIVFAICTSLVLVAGQNFLFGTLPNRQINFNTLDFPQPTQVRDPRQNRGPVVFPPSPPDAIDESSGVIVGASGYGFVPPQQRTSYFTSAYRSNGPTSYAEFNYYNFPYLQRFTF
ncbi:uncharacterized protein LOC111688678 [Lucilia cuprina]|uniref:uncharacterized protein LOC111688678 n=1 Tax=Lucilia cuprina TaxID=7375 RepID=UPI001F05C1E8|nr:uncharacterized protein LOC111688678 [Lucilia cuprina]